jgi:hypothetical protein
MNENLFMATLLLFARQVRNRSKQFSHHFVATKAGSFPIRVPLGTNEGISDRFLQKRLARRRGGIVFMELRVAFSSNPGAPVKSF